LFPVVFENEPSTPLNRHPLCKTNVAFPRGVGSLEWILDEFILRRIGFETSSFFNGVLHENSRFSVLYS
jgi:hypothetical protein